MRSHLWEEFLEIARSFPWTVNTEFNWSLLNFTPGKREKMFQLVI